MQTISLRNMERAVKTIAGVAIENEKHFSDSTQRPAMAISVSRWPQASASCSIRGRLSIALPSRRCWSRWAQPSPAMSVAALGRFGERLFSRGADGEREGNTHPCRSSRDGPRRDRRHHGPRRAQQGDKTLLERSDSGHREDRTGCAERPEDCLASVSSCRRSGRRGDRSDQGLGGEWGRQSFVGDAARGRSIRASWRWPRSWGCRPNACGQ